MIKSKILLASVGIFTVLGLAACSSTPTSESAGQYIDSSAITTKVKAALLGAKGLNSVGINVNTYKNVVQLSGFVDSASQSALASQTARNVAGVQGVINNLVVKTSAQ